ncbi:hypothetical protein LTSEMIN_6398, partial [Salmonella enterica subsp. enterica serovar Minnesota str. A4-603]
CRQRDAQSHGGEVLETAEQVEKALDTLRTSLLAAIEAGDRIRLQ